MSKLNMETTVETTIGMDLGDKYHYYCTLDGAGRKTAEGRIAATATGLERMFAAHPRAVVAIEAGTHSAWISRALEGWGHRALVGNPRKLRMIYASQTKSDVRDAEMLARIARADPSLLSPIRHRGRQAQSHLAILRSRDALVKARTSLILHARGTVKATGERLPSCSAEAFARRAREAVPADLHDALGPVLQTIEETTAKIRAMDRRIEALSAEAYPETESLRAVRGVGPVTALAFVLTIEEPARFAKSRDVAAWLGLVPRRDQSGDMDKQLRITKAGDKYLRRLLISCAHYILGPFGGDSDLRRWGQSLCTRGGKNARKRAVVAVARKLAVLLHALWKNDEAYDPLRQSRQRRTDAESSQAA